MNLEVVGCSIIPDEPEKTTMGSLTPRQIECLAWVQEGKTAYEVGVILGISTRTVEAHLQHAYEALGVVSRIQAVLKARDAGLLPRVANAAE